MSRTVFVGLGEGIGNVLMGLPLVDALIDADWCVALDLRTTPPDIAIDLYALIAPSRHESLVFPGDEPCGPYDAAVLTHWWVRQGGPLPRARQVLIGPAATEDAPEILTNLEAAAPILSIASRTQRFGRVTIDVDAGGPMPHTRHAVIHPGCKPLPEWRARKLYPRWAETVLRLKQSGFDRVTVVGSKDDADLFVGEPTTDLREAGLSLVETARVLSTADVVLSGDSGVHHLAVALGVPTVAIFGQSSPIKAMHVNPRGPAPVVLGPTDDLASIDPRAVAAACVRVVEATMGSAA